MRTATALTAFPAVACTGAVVVAAVAADAGEVVVAAVAGFAEDACTGAVVVAVRPRPIGSWQEQELPVLRQPATNHNSQ